VIAAADLEPVADDAWPARERQRLGDWRLNAADGWSMRTSACWPLGEPGQEIEAAITAVEAFYAARSLPPRFKLADGATQPVDLAERLARRGYGPCKETLVMTGPACGAADSGVVLTAAPDPAFEAVFIASAGGNVADARERLSTLARIPAPARFARLDRDGRPAAIGAVAVSGDWAGVFGMRTDPEHRRQGLARRVLEAMLQAARSLGATQAYLQVEADNSAAIALYRGLGFETAYLYRYWVRG
jgi:GNAT superfamily N-acetyltransferase